MSDDRMSLDQANMEMVGGLQRQQTNKRLAAIEKHLSAQQARTVVAQCPFCDGDLTKVNIEICKACGKELAWFSGIVYKPGESEKQRVMALAADRDECNRRMEEKLAELYKLKPLADNLKESQVRRVFRNILWVLSIPMMLIALYKQSFLPWGLPGVICFLLPIGGMLRSYITLSNDSRFTRDMPKGWEKNIDVDIAYFQSQLRANKKPRGA